MDRQKNTEKELEIPPLKREEGKKAHFRTIMAYFRIVGRGSSVRTLMHHLSEEFGPGVPQS